VLIRCFQYIYIVVLLTNTMNKLNLKGCFPKKITEKEFEDICAIDKTFAQSKVNAELKDLHKRGHAVAAERRKGYSRALVL